LSFYLKSRPEHSYLLVSNLKWNAFFKCQMVPMKNKMVYGTYTISVTMGNESGKTANEYFYDDGVKLVNRYAEC